MVDGAESQWNCPNLGVSVGSAANNRFADLVISNGGKVTARGMVLERGSSLLVTGGTLKVTSTLRIESSITNAAVISAGGILEAESASTIGTTFNGDSRDGTLVVNGCRLPG